MDLVEESSCAEEVRGGNLASKRRATGNHACVGHNGRTASRFAWVSWSFFKTLEIMLKGGKAYKLLLDQSKEKALIYAAARSGFWET